MYKFYCKVMFTFFGIGSSEILVAGNGSVSSLGTISSLIVLLLRDLFFIFPIIFVLNQI